MVNTGIPMNIEDLSKVIREDEYGRYIPMYRLPDGAYFKLHKYSLNDYTLRVEGEFFFLTHKASEGHNTLGSVPKLARLVFYEG